MADLRDERVVRASYLHQLLDLGGEDLKNVYEPISDQIGYIICFLILLMVAHFAWKRYLKWKEESKPKFIPYKVVKPPSSMLSEDKAARKKRVCAVVGGTGFIGSHVVNELVRKGNCYVFVLGRRIRPERINPDADCLIQVDLLDLDGLVDALQGVDSVINATSVALTVFTSADEVFSRSRVLHTNLIKASKRAGVKHFVHLSGIGMANKPKGAAFKALVNSVQLSERDCVEENGKNSLYTCVIGPCNILGLNSSLDPLLSGQMKSFPMSDKMPTSFMPVEYLCSALLNAESKLANPQTRDEVAGKVFRLRGEPMSWKEMLAISGWPHKISNASPLVLNVLVKINVACASLFHWAPFGAELSSFIMEITNMVEPDMSEEEVQEVYRTLEIGLPHPPIAEYIGIMAKKYEEKHSKQK